MVCVTPITDPIACGVLDSYACGKWIHSTGDVRAARSMTSAKQRCYDRAMTPIAPMTVTPKDQETADKSRSFSGGGKHEA